MTDLSFEINGVSFARLVHKNGIRTYLEPVYAGQVTTLDGVRRAALKRYRAALHVTLNDLDEVDSAALCAALLADPLEVTYFSWQRNATVTQTMRLEPYAREQLMRDGGVRVLAGVTLKFEQD